MKEEIVSGRAHLAELITDTNVIKKKNRKVFPGDNVFAADVKRNDLSNGPYENDLDDRNQSQAPLIREIVQKTYGDMFAVRDSEKGGE